MMKLMVALAVIGLAGPVWANDVSGDEPIALTDAQLEEVAAGTYFCCATNYNYSPLTITQTNGSLTTQKQFSLLAVQGQTATTGQANVVGAAGISVTQLKSPFFGL